MEKEFVPYELAVKLKALGFDESCFCWYSKEHEKCFILAPEYSNVIVKRDCISVPTFSQCFRWFREKYGLCGYVSPFEDASAFDFMIYTNINKPYANRICSLPDKWKTYEEAELACLDKLIEVVKSKSE